jgi:hypothetical protein
VEFDQQPDPGLPDRFTLHLRCRACTVEADFKRLTGKEAQWWINLFRMRHEERGDCPRRATG